MSLPKKLRSPIVVLNTDCLFHIFDHLQLRDLLNLRLQCRTLNNAVIGYLPQLKSLSIEYTEDSTNDSTQRTPFTRKRRKVSDEKAKEMKERFDDAFDDMPQKHFQRDDFITIQGQQKFEKFLEFIKKYLIPPCQEQSQQQNESRKIENIKKLAIIIDTIKPGIVVRDEFGFSSEEFSAISVVPGLLELCPKLDTLHLIPTIRRGEDWYEHEIVFNVEQLKNLFDAIVGLADLKELYFFTLQDSTIKLECSEIDEENDPNGQLMIGNFLSTMLHKLRIFSMNRAKDEEYDFIVPEYLTPLLGQSFDGIQELVTQGQDIEWLTNNGTTFKNLRSLTLLGDQHHRYFGRTLIGDSFQQLRVLQFGFYFPLSEAVMLNLKLLPNLEEVSADSIYVLDDFHPDEPIGDQYVNRTIKHIQIGFQNESFNPNEFFPYTDFFKRLQTVTILRPEKIVYQPNNFNDIRIGRW